MIPEPLTGEPHVVGGHGEAYVATATAIETAIARLREIRDEDSTIAQAFDRVRDVAGEVSEQIARAQSRYEVTGQALVDYAAELAPAQVAADDAVERWQAAGVAVDEAEGERQRLEALPDVDDAGVASARADLVDHQAAVVAAQALARDAAFDDWLAAFERKREAADAAEARIRTEIEESGLEDSFWDDLWGGIGDLLSAIADAIVEVLRWIGAVVLVAVGALVLAALAVAMLAMGGIAALVGAILLATVALWMLGGGSEAFVRTLLATGDLSAATMAGAIAALRTAFPWVLDWLVASDAGVPELQGKQAVDVRVDLSDASAGDLLAELQAGNRSVDAGEGAPKALDGEDSTTVRVTEVVGPDGVTRYRVSIPSTQHWVPGTDGVNDIASDAAAKFGTDPTLLEQAVQQALVEAEVPDGAHLLLSGWSLGGITAANLAADPAFAGRYDVDAIVVAGAPIDDVAIPSHIPVLSVEHAGDPVPLLEDPGLPYRGGDANRTTISVAAPDGAPIVPHTGAAYEQSLQQLGDLDGGAAEAWADRVGLERWFADRETQHTSVYQRGSGAAG